MREALTGSTQAKREASERVGADKDRLTRIANPAIHARRKALIRLRLEFAPVEPKHIAGRFNEYKRHEHPQVLDQAHCPSITAP